MGECGWREARQESSGVPGPDSSSWHQAAGASVTETGPNARLGEPLPHPGPIQGSLLGEKPLRLGARTLVRSSERQHWKRR